MGSASGTNKGTHFELRKLSNSYYLTIKIKYLRLFIDCYFKNSTIQRLNSIVVLTTPSYLHDFEKFSCPTKRTSIIANLQ
jgi:hypothetical protein